MAKGELILENVPEVKKLIDTGKTNGEVTYDEINDILPDKLLNSDKIDDIFIMLNQLGIDVVEESSRKPSRKKQKKKSGASTKKSTSTTSIDDPIRLYLKEIGKVSLLSGDQEVDLAKRIEEGELLIENSVLNSTLLINDLIKNYPKVKGGKIRLTDVLKVNRLYYFSSIDLKTLEKKYYTNMNRILAEDKKIIQAENRLRKSDGKSSKAKELQEKIEKSREIIRKAITKMDINEKSYQINGAIFEVNRGLGSGFLEKGYEQALLIERVPIHKWPFFR